MRDQHLAIVGGGPKAIAVAIKNKVLSDLGFQVPRLSIYEKNKWSAHWDGHHGYTDGHQRLGVSAEKDVGYPYTTQVSDPILRDEINAQMLKYSFAAYLISKQAYGEYIDRSLPAPTHREWSNYLEWVAKQTTAHVSWHFSEVQKIKLASDHWQVFSAKMKDDYDAVMITGLGKHKRIFPQALPVHPRALTSCDFWKGRCQPAPGHRVAIIGGGENAASVAVSLIEQYPTTKVHVISPQVTPFTRCEHYAENRFFSEPEKHAWQAISLAERRQFMARTDVGVISTQAMQVLQKSDNVLFKSGWLKKLTSTGDQSLQLSLEHHGHHSVKGYDWVILAIGFDFIGFVKDLLQPECVQKILQRTRLAEFSQDQLEGQIGYDLSLNHLHPKLFLPTLAGLCQGPGFPNLSCLGQLSDRVHSGYLAQSTRQLTFCK